MSLKTLAVLFMSSFVAARHDRHHFYTTDPNGGGAAQGGFTVSQLPKCFAYTSHVDGTTPMYRCYNGDFYFYTTSSSCENSGYSNQGVAWYCYPNQAPDTISLDRYLGNSNGDHWYIRRGEVDPHPDPGHYHFEGTACYVYANQENGAVPVYEWAKGDFN